MRGFPRPRPAIGFFLLAFLPLAGCSKGPGKEVPPTYPVTGEVRGKEGRPFPGGWIEFQSTGTPPHIALGEIQPDGKFSLETRLEDGKVSGAVEGRHRVSVMPKTDGQSARPVVLPELFTVKPGDANHFRITLPGR